MPYSMIMAKNNGLIIKMNEKIIDDLMKQSYRDMDAENRIFSPEMFAELIVRECMKQCQQQWYDENNMDTTDMNSRDIAIHVGKKSGYIQCINSIKEHFGVKK